MPVPNDTKFRTKGEERPPVPEDVYQCEILDITFGQKPKYQKPGEIEDVLTFKFGIIEQGDYYGRWLFKDMRPLLTAPQGDHSASNLYEFLSAVYGRNLTEEECGQIDADAINSLIGKQVRLTVKITPKGKNKIDGALKAKVALPALVSTEVAKKDDDMPF